MKLLGIVGFAALLFWAASIVGVGLAIAHGAFWIAAGFWLFGAVISFFIVIGLMSVVFSYPIVVFYWLVGWPLYVPFGIIVALWNP